MNHAAEQTSMDERQRGRIEELCQPLIDEMGPYLQAIWIYGSATRKDKVEGSDIDILVLLDDTKKDFSKETVQKAKSILKGIDDEAPEDLDLHFQPPKLLSKWWELLISGEPWVLTSMEDAQPIYDGSGYIHLTRELLRGGQMHGTEQRAHKLLKRSRKKIKKTRRLLLEDVTSELLRAMSEAAQANLMYYGHPPPSPDKIGDELQETFVDDEDLLPRQAVEDYRDLYRLTERIDHGRLTEFSGRELDEYLSKAFRFIKAMRELFEELEQQKQENLITESHNEMIELCREALDEKGVSVPTEDEAVLRAFKETFVEEGLISDEHWEAVKKIEGVKDALEAGKLEEMSEDEIYSSRVHLRDFESTVSNLLQDHEELPEPLEDQEDVQDDVTSITAIKEYTDQLLSEYEDVIKAVWILSSEDLKEATDVTAIILYNDLDDDDNRGESLEKRSRSLGAEIRSEQSIDIHPSFYRLSDYWNLIRHGSPVTFTEIREGIPVYDPSGFFLPLKKLLKNGKIPGTKEAMRSLIVKAPKRLMRVRDKYKAQILEQLYNAVVDAGQAALIIHGIAPPVQKRLPSELRTHLVPEGVMTENDVERVEDIITYWKDYEHGDIDRIKGEDLDKFMDDLSTFIDKVEDILHAA